MRHTFKAAVLAASSLLALPTAAAQENEEDVVVTAMRTPTGAADLPARVIVLDADAVREQGRITLDAALADVPGMQAPRTGPIGQQASVFSGGFESNQTLVLFDGIRIDDPSTPEGVFDAGQSTLGDAERIEIVQGPMSALYGSGALGGVVNVLPRRGGDGAFNPRFEAVKGSFDTLLGTIGAHGTVGQVRYAVTADAYASEGYDVVPERISAHTGERDGAEMSTLTGVFDFALSDSFSLDLLVRQREARADYDPGLFGNVGENPQAEILQNDAALWRVGATWTPAQALSLRISSGELDTDRVTADAGVIGDEYHGARRFADVLATWRVDVWTLVAGARTEDEEIDAISFGSPVVGEQTQWGAYAAVQGDAGALDLTAALRHDDFDGFGGEDTWRAGASYRIGAHARVYAAYGTSYRAPSLYERFVPFFGAAGLRPESARSLELGGDAELASFGRNDGVEISALYRSSEIDNLIGFAGFSYANIDRADIRFAEMRVSVHPAEWLTARVSYANTDARDANTDEPLHRRPRHAWSALLEAERGPLRTQLAWRQVGARTDTIYDDLGFFVGAGRVSAYDVVSVSASWAADDNVFLFVAADNVLDEAYEPVNGFAGAPASALVGIRVRPGANRYRPASN